MNEILLLIRVQGSDRTILRQLRRATSEEDLGGALAKESIARSLERHDDAHALASRREGEHLCDGSAVGSDALIVGVGQTIDPCEQRALGRVAGEDHLVGLVLEVAGGVARNGVRQEELERRVETAREAVEALAGDPALRDGHSVLRQGAGLVGADLRHAAHGLARGQVAHEVLVAHHALGRVGERDRDGERQTLGHGDDHDRDRDDEELHNVEDANPVPRAAGAEVLVDVDAPVGEQNEEDQQRDSDAEEANVARQAGEFALQRRVLALDVHLAQHLAPLGAHADGGREHDARAVHDAAAREHEALFAALALRLGLAGHVRLVARAAVARDVDAVGRHLVALLERDHVADQQLGHQHLGLLAATNHTNRPLVLLGTQHLELQLLRVVVARRHGRHDHDRQQDGRTLDPCRRSRISLGREDHRHHDRDDGRCRQDQDHLVLKCIPP